MPLKMLSRSASEPRLDTGTAPVSSVGGSLDDSLIDPLQQTDVSDLEARLEALQDTSMSVLEQRLAALQAAPPPPAAAASSSIDDPVLSPDVDFDDVEARLAELKAGLGLPQDDAAAHDAVRDMTAAAVGAKQAEPAPGTVMVHRQKKAEPTLEERAVALGADLDAGPVDAEPASEEDILAFRLAALQDFGPQQEVPDDIQETETSFEDEAALRMQFLTDFAEPDPELAAADAAIEADPSLATEMDDDAALEADMKLRMAGLGASMEVDETDAAESYTFSDELALPELDGTVSTVAPPKTLQQKLATVALDEATGKSVDSYRAGMMTRMGRALKKPKTYAGLVPGAGIAMNGAKVRHEGRKNKAMTALRDRGNPLLDNVARSTATHAKVKRNVAAVKTATAVASTAANVATGGVAGAVGGAIGGIGGAIAGAAAGAAATGAVQEGAAWGADRETQRVNRARNPTARTQFMTGSGGRAGNLNYYKNNRALLYHLGRGYRDADQLAADGSTQAEEEARLQLKRELGGSFDQDLTAREQREIPGRVRTKKDWLTASEREVYEALKNGEMTGAEVPPEMLLPILWEANKIFDHHAMLMAEAAAATG